MYGKPMEKNVSEKAIVEEIGVTEELNSIYSVTINSTIWPNSTINVVECGVHAREWISHAFCLFLIHEILWGFYQVSSESIILCNLPPSASSSESNLDYFTEYESRRLSLYTAGSTVAQK